MKRELKYVRNWMHQIAHKGKSAEMVFLSDRVSMLHWFMCKYMERL